MKSFFEDLGRKIGETTETVTSKANEMMEIQRLRNQIRSLERDNEKDMLKLGKMVYDSYKAGNVVEVQAEEYCQAIEDRKSEIEKYNGQIEQVKGAASCEICGKSVAKEMAYCPYCGAKMGADIWEETKDKAEDIADAIKEKAEDTAQTVREKTENAAQTVKDKAEDAAQTVKEKAEDAADAVRDKVGDAAQTVKEKAGDAAEKIKEKSEDAVDAVKEKVEEAADKVTEFTEK